MKLKHYGIALIPLCTVTFLFRMVEIVLAVDPKTGYYTGTGLPTGFNLFLAAATLFFVTLFFTTKKEPRPTAVRLTRGSAFDMVVGIAAAVFLVASSLVPLLEEILENEAFSAEALLRSSYTWQTLLALLSALFLIFFVTYPKKRSKKELWRVFSLAPVFFYLILLVRSFTDSDIVFSKSYGIYQIVSYGMIAAAGINLSKLLCGALCRRSYLFFTFEAMLFLSLRLADAVVYLIPGNPYNVPMNVLPLSGDLFLTVLLLSLGWKLMRKRKKKPSVEVPNEPETAAPLAAEPSAKP